MIRRSPGAFFATIAGAATCTVALSCGGPAFTAGTAGDAGVDTGEEAGPCASPASGGLLCLTLQTPKEPHPGYDPASGAVDLGIDGNGQIEVLVFDRDPTDPSAKVTQQHFPLGGTLSIDQFPVTVSIAVDGSASPYQIFAAFQDADITRVTRTSASLPGDFVTALTYDGGGKGAFPMVTVPSGAVVPLTLTLAPLRALDVTLTVEDPLKNDAMSTANGIHGDGPVVLPVYGVKPNTPPIDIMTIPCVDFMLPSNNPTPITKRVPTVADGTRLVTAVLFDYGYTGASPEPGADFSGPTPFTFAVGRWLTNVTVPLTQFTPPPAAGDGVHCP